MNMTRSLNTGGAALLALFLITVFAPAAPALALDRAAWTLEILVDGVPIQEHAARGTTYVEALAGREYSVRLRNNTPERIAVALSVDGLNTIDAKSTTTRDASKWILDPYQTITLDGWQTSNSTARRFFFTTEPKSYGAWLGETRNLGIITAAVFRERRPRPAPIMKQQMAPPAAPEQRSDGSSLDAAPKDGNKSEALREMSDDYAATGIGSEVDHSVTRVSFDAEKTPAAVLDIRYEYRDALVRLGVLPRPLPPCDDSLDRRERARGFDGMEFAPDPYRPRCR
jgi:hypothetical protein